MAELAIIIGISFVLLVLNGIYVAAEFAVISLPKIKLEQQASEGDANARRYLGVITDSMRQDRYIAVAQMGITLASLGLGMYGEHALAHWLEPYFQQLGAWSDAAVKSISVGTSLLLLTYFHIVIGEMVPKSLALMHPIHTAKYLWWPMRISAFILAPLGWLLNNLGFLCLRILGLPVSQDLSTVYSPDELRLVMEESKVEGLLPPEQHQMLERVMDFGERHLRLVMVPRTKVVGIPETATVTDALALLKAEEYSRFPVYRGDRDNIISVLHVKDLFGALRRGETERLITELAHPVEYFPESLLLDDALEKLRAAKAHFAVVVEDRGGTAGIVTAEDLIEELFGEIRDEFDEDELPLAEATENGWRVHGRISLLDLEEILGEKVEIVGDAETVTGLLSELLAKVPEVGDVAVHCGFRYEVESVEQHTVSYCRICPAYTGPVAPEEEPEL
ncbi:MAG: hemolysin family protein [Vulcanimicrobiota bacterium]